MGNLVRISELAKYLGVSSAFVYKLIRIQGLPKPIKLGTWSRWDIDDIDLWVTRQKPYILAPNTQDLRGTVICGESSPRDLIPAFLAEIERRNLIAQDTRLVADAEDAVETRDFTYGDALALDLTLLLNHGLPRHMMFGAHFQDPQDFGYWPIENFSEGVPSVS